MHPDVNLILLTLAIGLVGWVFYFGIAARFGCREDQQFRSHKIYETCFAAFLAGFVLVCVVLFTLAAFGLFTWIWLAGCILALTIWAAIEWKQGKHTSLPCSLYISKALIMLLGGYHF